MLPRKPKIEHKKCDKKKIVAEKIMKIMKIKNVTK